MTAVRFGFSPGRFDAAPDAVGRYARAVIDAHDLAVLLTTETYSRKLARGVRRRLPEGWVARRQGEFLYCWDRSVLRRARRPLPRLRRLSWVYWGRDAWRDARLATRHLVVRKTGARIILDDSHLQAGVEMGSSWRVSPWPALGNGRGHRAATRRWGRLIARRHRARPDATQVAFMDANLDQRNPVWRAHLTDDLGMPSIWGHHMPKRGTHGGRLIDTCHTTAPVIDAGVSHVAPPVGMDHTAIWCVLDVPDPRKKAAR